VEWSLTEKNSPLLRVLPFALVAEMIRVSCWCAGAVKDDASLPFDLPQVDEVPFVVADLGDGVRAEKLVLGSGGGAAGNLNSMGGGCGRRASGRIGSKGPIGLVAGEPGRLGRPKLEVSTVKLPLGCSFGASANGKGKAWVGDLTDER
jgi:hypothetical protein